MASLGLREAQAPRAASAHEGGCRARNGTPSLSAFLPCRPEGASPPAPQDLERQGSPRPQAGLRRRPRAFRAVCRLRACCKRAGLPPPKTLPTGRCGTLGLPASPFYPARAIRPPGRRMTRPSSSRSRSAGARWAGETPRSRMTLSSSAGEGPSRSSSRRRSSTRSAPGACAGAPRAFGFCSDRRGAGPASVPGDVAEGPEIPGQAFPRGSGEAEGPVSSSRRATAVAPEGGTPDPAPIRCPSGACPRAARDATPR